MSDKQQKLLIKDKLKDMKYQHLHKEILNILLTDDNFSYSSNMNGLYFDINKIDGYTLDKLNELLTPSDENDNNNILHYKPYYIEKYSNIEEEADKLQRNLRKLKIVL